MGISLNLSLNDVEACGIGLAGYWKEIPTWLHAALDSAATRSFAQLLSAAKQNAQVGLLEHSLSQCKLADKVDRSVYANMQAFNWESRLIDAALWSALSEIDFVLGGLGIRPVYLKGPITSRQYYRVPWHRTFKDIDFLVDEDNALEAYTILQRMGYRQGRFDRARRKMEYRDEPVNMDDPRGYELPRMVKMIPVQLDDVWINRLGRTLADSDRVVVENKVAFIPSQVEIHYALEPDRRVPFTLCDANIADIPHGRCLTTESQLIYLCYKAYVDIVLLGARGGVKLIADIVRLIEKDGHAIDWHCMINRYHENGLCAPIKYILSHAHAIYGCQIDIPALGECSCTSSKDEVGDVVAGSPLDLGDFLPFLARGRRPVMFHHDA